MTRARICIVAVALCAPIAARAQAASSLAASGLLTRVSPARVMRGHATTISGVLLGPAGPVAGELLELQADPRPYGRFVNSAHTITAADGRYRFARVRVYRDTRFRIADVGRGGRTGPTVEVVIEVPAYPSSKRVIAAAHYLSGRAGTKAFAVVDDDDRLAGTNLHRRFHSASVVKSMLLVAYLQMLAHRQRPLDGASRGLLYPMIHSSDNEAASAVLAIVGEGALDRVARQAGMADYEPGGALWGFTEVSAADLARFFLHQDAMIPRRFEGYARWLLSTIEPSESWGIPAVARPEFQVFFKGGWLPEVEGLVNQVARLERPGIVFALSVLTTHDPSMTYGEQTIAGVTARLLGRAG
jgi:hypothetical protein